MHTAFVTGCASGFGHALARRLLALGHRVVASDREPVASWAPALGAPRDALIALQVDLADPEAVEAAARRARAAGPVDLLVNNAGYAIFGTQEEADLDTVAALFDTNVLGTCRVTRALLPDLRATRGLIVQISSVAGRTVFPESGFYAATKYALEALTEALFQEVCTFGIRVRLVQPGAFDTGFLARATALSRPRTPDSPYASLHPTWDARKLAVLEPPQDPERVVDAIVAALDDPTPFRRVPVGPDSARILALRDALGPDAWTRLAADRNGLVAPHGPGEVLSPSEVLERAAAGDLDALRPAEIAARLGHLGHWAETDEGARALATLAGAR